MIQVIRPFVLTQAENPNSTNDIGVLEIPVHHESVAITRLFPLFPDLMREIMYIMTELELSSIITVGEVFYQCYEIYIGSFNDSRSPTMA